MNKGFNEGELVPVIARTFPFDQVVEAHSFMEANGHTGKIILTV